MNKFKLRNGITFLSVSNCAERKFNKFAIYLFIKRTPRNMILAKIMARFFDFNPIGYDNTITDLLREMYNASFEINCNAWEDKIYIKISISVLNDKYTFESDENLCMRALEILCDTLLKVDIEDREIYYQVISDIENEIECNYKEKENYLIRALHEFFPNTFAGVNALSSLREIDDVSYNITAKFYEELLRSSEILIFGYGLYEEGIVRQYLSERFKEVPKRRTVKYNFDFEFRDIGLKESQAFTPESVASNMTVLYWLGNSNEFENYNALAYVYCSLMQELMFNILREEKGLVYGISVSPYIRYSCLGVYGNIDESNFGKIIAEIRYSKYFSLDVYDDDTLNEKVEQFKKEMKLVLDECYDGYDFGYICYIYQDNLCKENIDKVTAEEIRRFAKNVDENRRKYSGVYLERKS